MQIGKKQNREVKSRIKGDNSTKNGANSVAKGTNSVTKGTNSVAKDTNNTKKAEQIAHKGSKEHGEGYKGKRATQYRPKRSGKGANSIKSAKVQQKA